MSLLNKLLPALFARNTNLKVPETVYNDSIIDNLALWEIIYFDDDYLEAVTRAGGEGIWGAREYCAAKISITVRKYYSEFGSDVDFDGVFIAPILHEMHKRNWCMNYDYSEVCKQTRLDWFGEEA